MVQKAINTSKGMSFGLSVRKTWCEEINIALDIEEHEPAELNRLLEKFYAEAKNRNGQDYEPDSHRVMIAALDRHLREKQYPLSIVKDRKFHPSKQVLEGKAKLLRQAGRGKRPNKARNLTKVEEEVLRKESKFGSTTPEAFSLVFICRENPRRSGILLFPDRPRFYRQMKTRNRRYPPNRLG